MHPTTKVEGKVKYMQSDFIDLTYISNFLSVVICKGFANNSLILNREYGLILTPAENDRSKSSYGNF